MYNNRQKVVFYKAIENNLEDDELISLIRVHIKKEYKGLTYYERGKIEKLADIEIENPKKMFFLFIIITKTTHGTLEQVAEKIKRPVSEDDFEVLQDVLYQLKIPKFEIQSFKEVQKTYDYYMKS